jgi:polar amino acid transport system substrate-binding protein
MTRFLLFVLAVLVTASCGSRAERRDDLAAITAAGTVRIGVKADAPPFGSRGAGEISGFDIDIARAVADHLGVHFTLVVVTSADRFQQLHAGAVDLVVATTTITRGRERDVDFSLPYFQDGQGLLVPAASPVRSYADLAGKRVAAARGSTSLANIRQIAPDAVVVEVANSAGLLPALMNGTADAATSDTLILMGLRQAAAKPDAWRIAGDRFSTEPYGIAMRQDQSRLRDAVNEALNDLWTSGRWQAMYDAWFGPGTPYATRINFAMPVYGP